MQTVKSQEQHRLAALDLLRFIAAMAVLLYHYVTALSAQTGGSSFIAAASVITRYGYLGVDLFFMISGFVILWSAQGRTAAEFGISRAGRLFPTFWVAMLLTLMTVWALTDPSMPAYAETVNTSTVLGNATMLPSVFNVPMIDGVYWTLEMEIRFYALVFMLLLFRQMQRVEVWLCLWLAVSIACTAIPMPWVANYLSIYPYGPLFITGCYFFLIYSAGPSRGRITGLVISCLLATWLSLEHREGFITPDPASSWVVVGAMMIFIATFVLMIAGRLPAPSRAAIKLGALTYPLYLVHGRIGQLLYPQLNGWPAEARILALTILALGLAYLLSRTTETYGRRLLTSALRGLAPLIRGPWRPQQ